MADLVWASSGNNNANLAANWYVSGTTSNPGSIGAADNLTFNNTSVVPCTFNLSTAGTISIESNYSAAVTFANNVGLVALKHDGEITASTTVALNFSGAHSGSAPWSGRPVIFGSNASIEAARRDDITYSFTTGSAVKFDYGPYPKMSFSSSPVISFDYVEPSTTAFTSAELTTLAISGSVTYNNSQAGTTVTHVKIIGHTNITPPYFTCTASSFEAENAKITFGSGTTANKQYIPVNNDTTNFNTTAFSVKLKEVGVALASGGSAGESVYIADGLTLHCESFELADQVVAIGGTGSNASSEIHTTTAPNITGSWNFKQVSPGVYRSGLNPSASFHTLTVTDKLTVGGLIDPTGLVIDEKANIGLTGHTTVGGKGLLWVKSDSPNSLYFTNDAGNDIALTSGSSATGSGGSGDIEGITTASNSGLAGGATSGTPSLSLDINNLTAEAIASGDTIAFNDSGDNGIHKESIDDIATLFAGDGLTASSAVLAVGAGTGIDVSGDAIAVDVSDFMSNGADNYVVTATGSDAMNAEANLQFDGTGLKIKEAAAAAADTAAYGQIWVKTATPNELYFTTDAGNDIQLTSGTSTAGGGGGASALDDLSDVSYSSGDLTISSLDKVTFANGGDATINVAATSSGTDGRDLTIEAGSAPAGSADQSGGDLILKAGGGDGTGTSIMTFHTKRSGTDAVVERMRIHTNGNVGIREDDPQAPLHVKYSATDDANPCLLLESTDDGGVSSPDIKLYRNSASPADNDYIGHLVFTGNNDAGTPEEIDYAHIYARISDFTDGTEDGSIIFRTKTAGANVDVMQIKSGNVGIGLGLNDPKTKLTVEGAITLKEQSGADADTAAYGQVWVKTNTPNELWFTDDAGNDVPLAAGGVNAAMAYSASDASKWSGGSPPTTVGAALDRLATWATAVNSAMGGGVGQP